MTAPPSLPRPVPFPVYGLSAEFTGTRNLVLWSHPGYVWTVILCFGDQPRREHRIVETIRKAPEPTQDDQDFPSSPARLHDAALHAIANATGAEVRGRQAKAAQRALHIAEVNLIDAGNEEAPLHGWIPTSLAVAGDTVPAFERDIGTVRAVVADLPDVVLSITSPPDFDPTGIDLVDVREHLDDYPWASSWDHPE